MLESIKRNDTQHLIWFKNNTILLMFFNFDKIPFDKFKLGVILHKTIIFSIPMIEKIKPDLKDVIKQCKIILCSIKRLAIQVVEEFSFFFEIN